MNLPATSLGCKSLPPLWEPFPPPTGSDTETNTTQTAVRGGLGTWEVKAVLAHMWWAVQSRAMQTAGVQGQGGALLEQLSLRLKAFDASLTLEVFYVF